MKTLLPKIVILASLTSLLGGIIAEWLTPSENKAGIIMLIITTTFVTLAQVCTIKKLNKKK